MKVLKGLLLLIVVGIAGLLIWSMTADRSYHVERTRVIPAPKEVVFEFVGNYNNWNDWSPWIENPDDAIFELGKEGKGIGSSYYWKAKDEKDEHIGEGKMTTLEYEENKKMVQHLQFIKPWESECHTAWNFKSTDTGVEVTWAMYGEDNIMGKIMMLFMGSLDAMVGPDFEKGLENIEKASLAAMNKTYMNVDGTVEHPGMKYIYISRNSTQEEVGMNIQTYMPKLGMFFSMNNIESAGMPFTKYNVWDEKNKTTQFEIGIPVLEKPDMELGNFSYGEMDSFKAIKVVFKGNYIYLAKAWEFAMQYMKENKLETVGAPMEVFETDPGTEPNPANWKTVIYIPIK